MEREKYNVTTGSSNLKLKVKWISQTELVQKEKAHVSPYNTKVNLYLLDTYLYLAAKCLWLEYWKLYIYLLKTPGESEAQIAEQRNMLKAL